MRRTIKALLIASLITFFVVVPSVSASAAVGGACSPATCATPTPTPPPASQKTATNDRPTGPGPGGCTMYCNQPSTNNPGKDPSAQVGGLNEVYTPSAKFVTISAHELAQMNKLYDKAVREKNQAQSQVLFEQTLIWILVVGIILMILMMIGLRLTRPR